VVGGRRSEIYAPKHFDAFREAVNNQTPEQQTSSVNTMANLDQILQRASLTSNAEEGLNELRYTILTQGIPANNEGMVS
jgi:hypothetical protein